MEKIKSATCENQHRTSRKIAVGVLSVLVVVLIVYAYNVFFLIWRMHNHFYVTPRRVYMVGAKFSSIASYFCSSQWHASIKWHPVLFLHLHQDNIGTCHLLYVLKLLEFCGCIHSYKQKWNVIPLNLANIVNEHPSSCLSNGISISETIFGSVLPACAQWTYGLCRLNVWQSCVGVTDH